MGIKKINGLEDFVNKFVRARGGDSTGLDAVTPAPVPPGGGTINPQGHTATGGVISDWVDPSPGNVYRTHIFTSTGTFAVSALSGTYPAAIEYLVIAGAGGGGAGYYAGGGGAGGVRTNLSGHPLATGNPSFPVSTSPGSYTVTVGGGGAGAFYPGGSNAGDPGIQGIDSYFGPPSPPAGITAKGGGKGMGRSTSVSGSTDGYPGGSGGGIAYRGPAVGYGYNPSTPSPIVPNIPSPHPYTITQGYPGGPAPSSATYGSGGGGAGGPGAAGGQPAHGADGGAGSQILIAGSPTTSGVGAPGPGGTLQWFAGGGAGGGGGSPHPTRYGGGADPTGANTGTGPFAGGGNGGDLMDSPLLAATSGTAATGGGGGGGTQGPDQLGNGGNGGSGIVAVRYQIGTTAPNAKATGGAISLYNSKWIHTFTTSGTFVTGPTWTSATVDYLVVGGGGSGGGSGAGLYGGGGGGAGAVRIGTTPIGAHPVSTTIKVGAGGAGVTGNRGNTGTESYFGTPITAPGGGGGGGTDPNNPGGPGGSGGGSKYAGGSEVPGGSGSGDDYPGSPPDASPSNGWGNDGGPASPMAGGGGGGGGASSTGSSPPGGYTGGPGGTGIQIPSTFYDPTMSTIGFPGASGTGWIAGGGGGSTYGNPNSGGGGGGGATAGVPALGYAGAGWGQKNYSPGDPSQPIDHGNAKANSGSGGGSNNNGRSSFDGGSGLVIIAYPST